MIRPRDVATRMAMRTAVQRELTNELFGRIYQELHAVARQCLRHERPDHTLQATALVHEAFLQLTHAAQQPWFEREHLLALAARAIRRVLVNHARARRSRIWPPPVWSRRSICWR
jgi:hypothetical protein